MELDPHNFWRVINRDLWVRTLNMLSASLQPETPGVAVVSALCPATALAPAATAKA